MKSLFDKVVILVQAQKVLFGVGALVVVVAGVTLFSSSGNEVKTIVVEKKEFVQQVSVSGRVEAANEVDLGFSQSGRIARIYAKEGQQVGQGTLIAEIENGDLYAALLQKEAALDRARAELDALKRGTRPEEIAVKQSTVASAQASLTAANQAIVDAIFSAFSTSDGAIHATVDQFFSNPNTPSPQLTFLTGDTALRSVVESRRVTMEALLKNWQQKNASLTSSGNLAQAAQDSQVALQSVATYLGDVAAILATSIPTSAVSASTLDAYKTSVATARANVNTVTSTLTTALKTQTAAQTALVTAERDLVLLEAGATEEDLRAQEASVKVAEADVLSASSQLGKTQIRAPFAGTVTKIDAKVGKSAQPGEAQVSVIGSGAFQVETFVPELNVALVKVGDPADVTFDSYGDGVTFPATVLTVDLGETVKDGVSTYRTVLVFTATDARVRSGMTANVVITTMRKADTIAIPQKLVVQKDGAQVVKVLEADVVVEKRVTTGSVSSTGDIEVVSGLSVGDHVILE